VSRKRERPPGLEGPGDFDLSFLDAPFDVSFLDFKLDLPDLGGFTLEDLPGFDRDPQGLRDFDLGGLPDLDLTKLEGPDLKLDLPDLDLSKIEWPDFKEGPSRNWPERPPSLYGGRSQQLEEFGLGPTAPAEIEAVKQRRPRRCGGAAGRRRS
jgi:hypothetical protein